MEDFYFDQNELIEIHKLFYWTYGSEGYIYRIPDGRKNVILKLFYNPLTGKVFWPTETMKNKETKIGILQSMVLPNQIQVENKVFLGSDFIGYTSMEAMNQMDFCFNNFTTFQKLEFLNRLRKKLERFHSLGLIYGDLKSNNVLAHPTNYKKSSLCDLDNMQVLDHPIDIVGDYMDEFLYQYGDVDERLDWYVLNLLTLETIFDLDKTTCLAYDETRKFMDHYRGNSEALRSMQQINPHYEGKLLIDDPAFYEEIGYSKILH